MRGDCGMRAGVQRSRASRRAVALPVSASRVRLFAARAHRWILHLRLRSKNAEAINTSVMKAASEIAAETLFSVWTIVAPARIDCRVGPVADIRRCEAVVR